MWDLGHWGLVLMPHVLPRGELEEEDRRDSSAGLGTWEEGQGKDPVLSLDPALSSLCCVTLGKSLNFSVSQMLVCSTGMSPPVSVGCCEDMAYKEAGWKEPAWQVLMEQSFLSTGSGRSGI